MIMAARNPLAFAAVAVANLRIGRRQRIGWICAACHRRRGDRL